jgi:histone H1/5
MKAALKRGVETGTLVMIKSSYKVSSDAKKPLKKAAAPKVAKAVVAKVRMCCIL